MTNRWVSIFIVGFAMAVVSGCGGADTGDESAAAQATADSGGGMPVADLLRDELGRFDVSFAYRAGLYGETMRLVWRRDEAFERWDLAANDQMVATGTLAISDLDSLTDGNSLRIGCLWITGDHVTASIYCSTGVNNKGFEPLDRLIRSATAASAPTTTREILGRQAECYETFQPGVTGEVCIDRTADLPLLVEVTCGDRTCMHLEAVEVTADDGVDLDFFPELRSNPFAGGFQGEVDATFDEAEIPFASVE